MGKVFFFLLSNNTNIYYKEVLALTFSLSNKIPKTSLINLDLFISLMGRRLLFPIKYISKKGVSRLILPRVLIFFFYWPIALETIRINLLHAERRL